MCSSNNTNINFSPVEICREAIQQRATILPSFRRVKSCLESTNSKQRRFFPTICQFHRSITVSFLIRVFACRESIRLLVEAQLLNRHRIAKLEHFTIGDEKRSWIGAGRRELKSKRSSPIHHYTSNLLFPIRRSESVIDFAAQLHRLQRRAFHLH